MYSKRPLNRNPKERRVTDNSNMFKDTRFRIGQTSVRILVILYSNSII